MQYQYRSYLCIYIYIIHIYYKTVCSFSVCFLTSPLVLRVSGRHFARDLANIAIQEVEQLGCSLFQKTMDFQLKNVVFFYIIVTIIMPSTNITLDARIVFKLLMSENPHCLT